MKHKKATESLLALVMALLAACGGTQATLTPAPVAGGESYSSAYLDTSYPRALNVSSQLALGTLLLEETDSAVTTEQAAALLPLWQAIRAGTLQNEAETNAVLKQIEATMTVEQMRTIAAMQLTWEDLQSWAQTHGLSFGLGQSPGLLGEGRELPPELHERLKEQFGGQVPDPEAIATLRAQRGSIGEEERQQLRATAQASGRGFGGRRFGTVGGEPTILLDPLIELLTQRAAE